MTVENTQNKMPPLQMGTTNEYPFTFAVLLQDPTEEEAVEAIKASVLQADGTEIELVYNTDYTVTLNTDRIGGTLTVNDIRTSSDYITIYRQYAQTQEVDYKDFNSAPAETFEQCFDKLTMLSQQQQEEINRSIKLPVSSDITNLSLPNPVAGRTLKWNESETGLINSDVSIDEIDDSVQAALEASINATQQAEIASDAAKEALEAKEIFEEVKIIATLDIGDIGFTQMAIDETKGKRRKLNGQLIIQDQYIQLTNIIKNSVALNPDLACTESEWQTAVTMSTNGVCYKFVIDDNAGTIRLPKYPDYFIAGLTGNAPVFGNGMTLGLVGKEGKTAGLANNQGSNTGAMLFPLVGSYGLDAGTLVTSGQAVAYSTFGVTTDPIKSGIEAQLSNNQTEQIKGTYFIQVATGSETEDNIINEIELNNPFSLLDYKYSEYELNNLSWLRSEGQYNSKTVYPAVYERILENVNKGVKNFKGKGYAYLTTNSTTGTQYNFYVSTVTPVIGATVYDVRGIIYGKISSLTSGGFSFLDEIYNVNYTVVRDTSKDKDITDNAWISDYDFVLNTAEETFRLPLLDGSESLLSDRYDNLTLGASGDTYTAPANGWLTFGTSQANQNGFIRAYNENNILCEQDVCNFTGSALDISIPCKKGHSVLVTYHNAGTLSYFRFVYAQGNGSLYFYVGETVQNANLINAGRIEEHLHSLIPDNSSLISSYAMPSSKYIDLTLGASGTTYTAPANGWMQVIGTTSSTVSDYTLENVTSGIQTYKWTGANNQRIRGYIPCEKGDTIRLYYYAATITNLRFIYAQGEV